MIDFADAKAAIQAWIAAQWTATPIAWENTQFVPTEDASYLRVVIAEGVAQPGPWIAPDMAGPRQSATIQIVACVPIGVGDAPAEVLLTAAKKLLSGKTIIGESTTTYVQNFMGHVSGTEGAWFKKMIACNTWITPNQ